MATLVRCIEGHAFDLAASETCPIFGSTVWKNEPVKEPVYENRPPLNRTKIIENALGTIGIIVFFPMLFAIALGIGQLMPVIKSAIHDYWQRVEALERAHSPPPSPEVSFRKACEEMKLHDCRFPPPKPQNPFAPKPGDTVAPKPEKPFVPEIGNLFGPKTRVGPNY
jgi:hypothetical protein